MKYLLILFGLSSVLASENNFLSKLYELRLELKDSQNIHTMPCLDKFINDYSGNFNYGYAINAFESNSFVEGQTCSELTKEDNLSDRFKMAFLISNQRGTWSDLYKTDKKENGDLGND